ncbi:tRNA (adenine(22)-N(1))-methyltransferase TrmK [Bacillus swezeyi]|uniref:tRNA (adenine(22)-N(1))-methyltransferase n=1 Tax=Bacillus swezeyi TaxID=1925020 RepID=UPI002E2108EF|nr:tRNA (adenine(22)-N(1))-methyltransferase TrmK [Bacillus swezeyi]
MNELKLSKRLETVAKYIPEHAVLADIGSDHAYLPCYALLNGLAKRAIAGEITDGPFNSAKNQVERLELSELISVRKGDGLEVVKCGEADAITIAGMGGALIADILEKGKDKLEGVRRLILQPNIHAYHIREWLYKENYELLDEEILEEDGKFYEVLAASPGDKDRPYKGIDFEIGMLIGPFLSKEKNAVFIKKWSRELHHLEGIYRGLENADPSAENQQKQEDILKRMKQLKEALDRG